MSSSADDKHDELEHSSPGQTFKPNSSGTAGAPPVKRGRGRPKGSKNKKTLAAEANAAGGIAKDSAPTGKKRSRSAKNGKKEDEDGSDAEAEKPKRKRGRPSKASVLQAEALAAKGDTAATIPMEDAKPKSKGRPKKPTSSG